MVVDKVVSSFHSDLDLFTKALDSEVLGLVLVMIFQKRSPIDSSHWILTVSADGLDDLTQLGSLSKVDRLLTRTCTPNTIQRVERISVLRVYDDETQDILGSVESPRDSRFLIGKSVFGRRIARARLLFLRKSVEQVLRSA